MNKPKAPAAKSAATGQSAAPAKPGAPGAPAKPGAPGTTAKPRTTAKSAVSGQSRASGPVEPASQAAPERPAPPRSVFLAVRLMYAGAALTAIGMVVSVVAVAVGGENALRASHKHATLAQLHATQNFLITGAIVSGLVEIGAWLFMARANRSGLKWARIIASVLFALNTLNFMGHMLGKVTIGNIAYSVALWLVGLGALYFLWQKDASAYFADRSG